MMERSLPPPTQSTAVLVVAKTRSERTKKQIERVAEMS